MKSDPLGDRMKMYENQSSHKFMPLLPVCARLDGKCFSKFTKGMARPYDNGLSIMMIDCTRFLVEHTGAAIGYTQSDEISLVWYSSDPKSQIFFDGKPQKMISILAAMLTLEFNRLLPLWFPDKVDYEPLFDCRVWTVPTKTEAVNNLIWREQDATRNSIGMAASCEFSHSALQNKTCNEMQEMLLTQKDINWNKCPTFFKRGTYVRRIAKESKYTTAEIDKLPKKHDARKNPDLIIRRHCVECTEMPILSTVTNRIGVVFDGEEPRVGTKP